MQLITATLTENPKAITTKYGDKTVADARTETGETFAVWRPANDPVLMKFRQGDRVSLARDSKGKISLIDSPAPSLAPTSTPCSANGLDKETKQAIAAYIGEMGDLYRYCYETAGEKLATAPNEAKQAMASSLFISAQKKFGLA